MPARSPQLMGDGCRDRGVRRRLAAQGAHPAGCARARRAPIRRSTFPAIICARWCARWRPIIRRCTLRPADRRFHPCRWRSPRLPAIRAAPASSPARTIGNFRPDAAMALLRRMRAMLNGGGLLVGVDLVKDPARLHAAYNDAAGVTALFNKNLLARANRELGADFDLDAFAHYAPYNAAAHRIEMYLVSLKRQSVTPGGPALRLRRRRSHPYRGQPQIHHRELPRDGGARRLQAPRGVDRSTSGCSRCTGWSRARRHRRPGGAAGLEEAVLIARHRVGVGELQVNRADLGADTCPQCQRLLGVVVGDAIGAGLAAGDIDRVGGHPPCRIQIPRDMGLDVIEGRLLHRLGPEGFIVGGEDGDRGQQLEGREGRIEEIFAQGIGHGSVRSGRTSDWRPD